METEVTKKLFTVDEYHRMAEAGIFHPEARCNPGRHSRRRPEESNEQIHE